MVQMQRCQANFRVDVESYPTLGLLCRDLVVPRITRRDAFAIYERNWRWIDVADTPAHERELIASPAEELGGGLLNA